MTTARAAVWLGKYKIQLRDYPVPEVKEDGLLLEVEAAGICGTDGHLIQQNPPYPAIMGHEIAGKIVAMGSRANNRLNIFGGQVAVGDRIVLYPWITCGKCEGCLTHRPGTCTTCDNSFVYGVPYSNLGLGGQETISSDAESPPHFMGGFAEFVYVFPETYAWKIPHDMPSYVAVLLDPLAVAVRAIELAQTCPGILEEAFSTSSRVVVLGAGPVGILVALLVRLMGAEQVVLVGSRDRRKMIAKELSQVDEIIDYHQTKSSERINLVRELTSGGGNLVIQCANTVNAFVEGLEMTRRLGTLIEVGNHINTGQYVNIDPARLICGKHVRIIGMSANHPGALDKAFHILLRHQQIPFNKLFTHTCDLEGILDTLKQMRDENYVKGLILPREELAGFRSHNRI